MSSSYNAFSESFAKSREKKWTDLEELMGLEELKDVHVWYIYDIGCGSWRLLEYFADKPDPRNYRGIDSSEWMLREAKIRHPHYLFDCQSMQDVLPGVLADTIFYIASFHHLLSLDEQRETLEAAKKILKKNGKIVLLNWNLLSDSLMLRYPSIQWEPIRTIAYNGNDRQYRAWWLEELTLFLQKAGFKILVAKVTQTQSNIIHIITPI